MLASALHIVGVGLEKAGTTTAHDVLARSPVICAPREKETFYFNRYFEKGAEFYRAMYPEKLRDKITIDITPSYHNDRDTLLRIKASIDGPLKVILFLRDPIARAFSLYRHDIFYHYSAGDRTRATDGTPFNRPFSKRFADLSLSHNYYFVDLRNLVLTLSEIFGDDLSIVYFDQIRSGTFVSDIERLAGQELGLDLSQRVHSNRAGLPQYNISENGLELQLLRPGLPVVSWSIPKIGVRNAMEAVAASQHWTEAVSLSAYNEIYGRLYSEMSLDDLGVDKQRLFEFGPLFV